MALGPRDQMGVKFSHMNGLYNYLKIGMHIAILNNLEGPIM